MKLFIIIFVLTFVSYIIKTILECVNLSICIECSAPWYTALVINSLIFVIPLLIEGLLLLYFYKRLKKCK